MASAGWLAPDRPDVYRPKGQPSGVGEPGRMAEFIERLRPDEGWVALPLVLILAATMAWSFADARWVLGQDGLTSFVIWVALVAAAWGYLSARLDISPWLAQAVGCTVGAFIVIEAVGASLPGAAPGLGGWFHATATSVTQAYLDLTWRHQASTLQVGHFCLIVGILVWGTAQAASYDVFGYHRTVNGVLLLAVVLTANMALTQHDQYFALVLFSAAALVLLLLAHAADERSSWLRHRIWRGRDFQSPHLRGGMVFAAAAVAGSLALTTVASSQPLSGPLRDLNNNAQNALSWLGGYLPAGGQSKIQPTSDFGSTASITSAFRESSRDVFTVGLASGSVSLHWRLVAYDTFQTTGWALGPNHEDHVPAGGRVDAGTLDLVGPSTSGRTLISIVVHVQDSSLGHVVVASEPNTVTADVQRTVVGSGPGAVDIAALATNAQDYTVTAFVPDIVPGGTNLTEWRLQHAGTTYPPGLQARYTQGAGLVGADGKALLTEIESWAQANGNSFSNEYDVGKAIQDYLQSNRFQYNSDISALMPRCTGLSTVDCFALIRQGFCEQYATTMTMLMRMQGYPARYVLGYLPGALNPHTNVQQVTSQQKHAWVEVFFPGFGWIPFDPTGGGVGRPTQLEPGSAVTPSPIITPTPGHVGTGRPVSPTPVSPAGAGSTQSTGSPAIMLVSLILGLVVLLALFVLWRRRPRRLDAPDTVYRNVVRLASRLGYKPQPTQTIYEYTGMLAEVVPQARDSLGAVAMATVEVTYGKRRLSTERLVFLATAQQLIRRALLKLAIRRPRLRGRGRGAASTRGRNGKGRPGS
jgi:Transglutaminase-like superfamily/TgpA N-terminal domain/Domain of unknown function (DUF4129)